MEIFTYVFSWNGRRRFIDATDKQDAMDKFQEKYGFYPEDVTVSIVPSY